MSKIAHTLLTVFILLNFIPNFSTGIGYLMFASVLIIFLMIMMVKAIKGENILVSKSADYKINLVPIILVMLWFYGFTLGILKGNETVFVIRNFAGLITYTIYYAFLVSNYNRNKLFYIVYYSSIFSAIVTLLVYLDFFVLKLNLLSQLILLKNFVSGGHNILYANQLLLFSLVFISLYRIVVFKKKMLINIVLFIISSFDIFIAINQGGFILGYFVLALLITFALLIKKVEKNIIVRIFVGVVVIIVIVIATVILYFKDGSFLNEVFSSEDGGNQVRLEQLNVAMNESTFLGEGLGATYDTYVRNEEFPYALEIIYLNIFHKFGIFALLIIYSYLWIILESIRRITMGIFVEKSILSLALIGFIFPSLGNPYLFSPLAVLLHCISFYLLNEKSQTYSENRIRK